MWNCQRGFNERLSHVVGQARKVAIYRQSGVVGLSSHGNPQQYGWRYNNAIQLEVSAITQVKTMQYDLLIDGEWRPASSGEYFDVENPATDETIAIVANSWPEDVAEAVCSAEQAFHGAWSAMPNADRGKILWDMASLIDERKMELGQLESISNGRPISETSSQMSVVASYFRYFAGFCDKIQGSTIPTTDSHFNYTLRVPLGVVGQLTPWNHPLMIASKILAPALPAG